MTRDKFIKSLMSKGLFKDEAFFISQFVIYFRSYDYLTNILDFEGVDQLIDLLKSRSCRGKKLKKYATKIKSLAHKYSTGGRWNYYMCSIYELFDHSIPAAFSVDCEVDIVNQDVSFLIPGEKCNQAHD